MTTQNNEELEILRRTNGELLAKSYARKTKIADLEKSIADLQAQLTAANNTIHDFRVSAPLRGLAAEISSKFPELFLDQFDKHFKVELIDGKLTVLDGDGKPVGVAFEREALAKFLTEGDSERAEMFRHIVTGSKASGAGGIPKQPQRQEATPTIQFGIR